LPQLLLPGSIVNQILVKFLGTFFYPPNPPADGVGGTLFFRLYYYIPFKKPVKRQTSTGTAKLNR
jgi:hypothetical protein